MPDAAPVILLGHGSRRFPEVARGLEIVARDVQVTVGPTVRVVAAFFEFLAPSLDEAVAQLAAEGARRVIVLPYFLFDGREVQRIIPEQLDALRRRFPALDLVQGPALGLDDRLVALAAQRAREALAGLGYHRPFGGRLAMRRSDAPLGVIVVNRGSRAEFDPGDRLRVIADRVGALLDAVAAAPAHAEYARPTIAESAALVVQAGARRVVVVPYLHFPGKVLFDNVVEDVERAARAHPAATFTLARTLCLDARLVALCAQRIGEALGQAAPVGA
jgi:sirohydrochlorin ferrochelatase